MENVTKITTLTLEDFENIRGLRMSFFGSTVEKNDSITKKFLEKWENNHGAKIENFREEISS